MKYIAQYVRAPVFNPGRGIGIIVEVNKEADPVIITVRWLMSGIRDTYYDDQLEVLCPTCAGQSGFTPEQLKILRKECELCTS